MREQKASRVIEFEDYYIYTPNLGSETAISDQEREQGRFRKSAGGAKDIVCIGEDHLLQNRASMYALRQKLQV